MEYVFPTGDRVDVVLIDGAGNVLLVEVKPFLSAADLAPFAQAAKYRVLWSILRERPASEIRCLVAAPGYRRLSLEEDEGQTRRRMHCNPIGRRQSMTQSKLYGDPSGVSAIRLPRI